MGLFLWLSFHLREHPLVTNICLSTAVGFCGDVVCQTVYEPCTRNRPLLQRSSLPRESASSSLLVEVTSPYLYWKKALRERAQGKPISPVEGLTTSDGQGTPKSHSSRHSGGGTPYGPLRNDTSVLVDFRRSLIFCSFTLMFGVPFFLQVYRVLDRIIAPHNITKKQAIAKGFLSFVAAQLTNPIFVAYVTVMDHFFIFRDGRDGRRRVVEIAPIVVPRNPIVFAGDDDFAAAADAAAEADSRALDATVPVDREAHKGIGNHFQFAFFSHASRSSQLEEHTMHNMGNYYRFVDDKSFNAQEFWKCVQGDVTHKLKYDFPDIVRYGFVFWGCNWLPLFYYIPSHFRLSYSACVQVVWSGVMSHLMHRGNKLHLNHRTSNEGHLADHLVTSS